MVRIPSVIQHPPLCNKCRQFWNNGERLNFSNYGSRILFCSCGKYIKTGKTAQISSYHQGTSLSAAIMSGIIARIKEEKNQLGQAAMIERLKKMTRRNTKDGECGFGIPTFQFKKIVYYATHYKLRSTTPWGVYW
jgi:hypothetical protein